METKSVPAGDTGMRRLQELLSQISAMTSGAPLTYTSMLVLFSRLTITLILRSADTNSNVRMTPSSRKCACYARNTRLSACPHTKVTAALTLPAPLNASSILNCALPGGLTMVCTSAAGRSPPLLALTTPVPAT